MAIIGNIPYFLYPRWNSHLVGIMISKTIGFRGLAYFQTNPGESKQGHHPGSGPQRGWYFAGCGRLVHGGRGDGSLCPGVEQMGQRNGFLQFDLTHTHTHTPQKIRIWATWKWDFNCKKNQPSKGDQRAKRTLNRQKSSNLTTSSPSIVQGIVQG